MVSEARPSVVLLTILAVLGDKRPSETSTICVLRSLTTGCTLLSLSLVTRSKVNSVTSDLIVLIIVFAMLFIVVDDGSAVMVRTIHL